jgi:hypothetical protein
MARKGLILALEEMENELPVEEVSDSDLMESRSDMDESVYEVDDMSTEIEDEVVAIEEAMDDIDTLSDIKDTMEDSIEGEGEGLDETAAEIAEVSVEAICNRLGFKPTYRPIPATESFSKAEGRKVQTQIAIEGLGDTIAKAWNAVKAAVQRVSDKVSYFLSGLTKNAQAVIKHLQDLKRKVSAIDSSSVKASEDLSNKSIAKAFSDNKEANFKTAMDIVSRTNVLIKGSQTLLSDSVDALEGLQSIFVANANAAKTIEATREKVAKSLEQKFGKLGKLKSGSAIGSRDGGELFGPVANCQAIASYAEEDGRIRWIDLEPFKEIQADSAKALDANEMNKLLDSTIALLGLTGDFSKQKTETEKAWKAIEALTDKITDAGQVENIGEIIGKAFGPVGGIIGRALGTAWEERQKDKTVGAVLREDITSYMWMVSIISSEIPGLGISTGKAVGTYVEASIANYKAPKAEAPAEEAKTEE